MKKGIVLILALAVMLSVCSIASAEEETVLKITWWGSQTRHDSTTRMLKLYEETHPGIKFDMDYATWGDYWDVMAAKLSGNTMPDIMQNAYGSYITQYAERGALLDFAPYIESGALDLSNCSDAIISSGLVNGTLYGIPTGTNALTLMYDANRLEGYEVPTFMTYSEYIDLAKQLYEDKGYTENFISTSGQNQVRLWVRNHGVNFFSDDGTTLGFDDPQIIADLFELIGQSINEGWGLNPEKSVAVDDFSVITAGDSWCTLHWTNELNACETGNGTPLTMVAIPAADDAVQAATYFQPSMLWSVSSASEVKDEAVEFINWFTNEVAGFEICGTDRGMPINTEVLAQLAPTFNEQNQKIAAILTEFAGEGCSSPIYPAEPAVATEIYDIYQDYANKIRYGQITDYLGAATEFMERAQALLDG